MTTKKEILSLIDSNIKRNKLSLYEFQTEVLDFYYEDVITHISFRENDVEEFMELYGKDFSIVINPRGEIIKEW